MGLGFKKHIFFALAPLFIASAIPAYADMFIRPMPQRSIFEAGGKVRSVRYSSISVRPMPQRNIYETAGFDVFDYSGGRFAVRGGNTKKYDEIISKAAEKFNLEVALIKAVIKAESNFNHRAVSHAGAQGLMQLMPATASLYNVGNVFHPEQNIAGGARHLRYLMDVYNGNLTLVLAAYNAGEKAVAKYGNTVPPYRETQSYVRQVLALYKHYQVGR